MATAGITGREGSFHTLNNRKYGTNVVGGVNPKKAGENVEGIPVFASWKDTVEETGANTAMIFVPPPFAAASILEAAEAGVELIIAITEGIPAHDELRVYNTLKRDFPNSRLVGPNCPGILSPGKASVGIIPASFFKEGNVGVVSRSGTLTYQIGNELAQAGFGNSSIVGIGGDPVPGSLVRGHHRAVRGRPADRADRAVGRDRRRRRGAGRRLHRRARDQAGGGLHRRLHRAPRQDDGPRRRHRVRLRRHGGREGRGAGGQGRPRGPHPDGGLRDRRRDPRRSNPAGAFARHRSRLARPVSQPSRGISDDPSVAHSQCSPWPPAVPFAACGDDEEKSGSSAKPTKVAFELKPDGKKATMTGPKTIEAGVAEITLKNSTKKGGGLQLIRVEGDHPKKEVFAKGEAWGDKGKPLPEWLFLEGGVPNTAPGKSDSVDADAQAGQVLRRRPRVQRSGRVRGDRRRQGPGRGARGDDRRDRVRLQDHRGSRPASPRCCSTTRAASRTSWSGCR